MKKKGVLFAYILMAVLLAHIILVVGCGKNPVSAVFGTSTDVGVGRL